MTTPMGYDVESHYACVFYDRATGDIHHVHHVVNLVGAQAPSHSEMKDRGRAALPEGVDGKLTVEIVDGGSLERGKRYRFDHRAKALVPISPSTV